MADLTLEQIEEWRKALKNIYTQTLGYYGKLHELINSIDTLCDMAKRGAEMTDAYRALVDECCEYAVINNLGDPEKQHNIKRARQFFPSYQWPQEWLSKAKANMRGDELPASIEIATFELALKCIAAAPPPATKER